MKDLALLAVGIAVAEVDHKVREEGGNNRGARINQYLRSLDPPIPVAAPWCAAFVQYITDVAANALNRENPLDGVRREAYVADYASWATLRGLVVDKPQRGDLALFDFRGIRWDHIGIVLNVPDLGGPDDPVDYFETVEGNTGSSNPRDGDGVYRKTRRRLGPYPTMFVRWWE